MFLPHFSIDIWIFTEDANFRLTGTGSHEFACVWLCDGNRILSSSWWKAPPVPDGRNGWAVFSLLWKFASGTNDSKSFSKSSEIFITSSRRAFQLAFFFSFRSDLLLVTLFSRPDLWRSSSAVPWTLWQQDWSYLIFSDWYLVWVVKKINLDWL